MKAKLMNKKIWLSLGGLILVLVNLFVGYHYYSIRWEEEHFVNSVKIRKVNLLPKKTMLVDSMVKDFVETGVANRSDVPLLTQISETDRVINEDSPVYDLEVLPWFYGSPNVQPVSEKSFAQKATLVSEESLNGFSWRDVDGKILLYQYDEPYTGFHTTRFDGWHYFVDGKMQKYHVPLIETGKKIRERQLLTDLVPIVRPNFVFLEPLGNYAQLIDINPVSYSILYKSDSELILTSPPGTRGSRLLTTTEDFVDIPMEVIEEVTTFDGKWIHVYVGYDELGWVKKDETWTDYVKTLYSERELLDKMEEVLAEEVSQLDARVGASFINNETMSQISVNNQVFFPASTQKIYVLGELYHQYATGELDPVETTVTLYNEDKVPGAGIIRDSPEGSVFTLDELVDLVVIYSDNTAANLLIEAVGGGEVINPHVHQMGLYDTYVTGKYYGGDSYFTTTPKDAARFFALLYNNQVNGAPYDEMLINKFVMNSHNFLRQYIWGETTSWNKSGLGGTEQNDVATFVTPYGSYSLAVYTAEPGNYKGIGDELGLLSLRVHDVFNEMRVLLWMPVDEFADSEDSVHVRETEMDTASVDEDVEE